MIIIVIPRNPPLRNAAAQHLNELTQLSWTPACIGGRHRKKRRAWFDLQFMPPLYRRIVVVVVVAFGWSSGVLSSSWLKPPSLHTYQTTTQFTNSVSCGRHRRSGAVTNPKRPTGYGLRIALRQGTWLIKNSTFNNDIPMAQKNQRVSFHNDTSAAQRPALASGCGSGYGGPMWQI